MDLNISVARQRLRVRRREGAVKNKPFVENCLKKIRAVNDTKEGLRLFPG